jgi:hypothetical protein
MSFTVAFLAAALLQQAPAPRVVQVTPNSSVAVTAPGALPDAVRPGDRLICRTESVVGSNRRQRVCMTEAQRTAVREQSRDMRERLDNQTAPPLPTASGG